MIYWIYGRSGSGKTTLAKQWLPLVDNGVILDGDVLRKGINADLGYDAGSRTENVRRAAHLAVMLSNLGHDVLVALTTPKRSDRALARQICCALIMVNVNQSIEVCRSRDSKGLYKLGILPEEFEDDEGVI